MLQGGGGGSPPRPPTAGSSPPRSSGAFLWGLGGGIVGGIAAALATLYLVPLAGGELSTLRGEVRNQGQAVEQVQARVQELAASTAGAQDLPGRVEALEQTLAASDERLGALERTGGDLGNRVAALEAAPEGAPDQNIAAQVAKVETALAALEDQVNKLGAGDGQRVSGLEDKLATLSATVAQLQAGTTAAPASDQLADLEQRVDRVAAATDRIAALSGKVDTLSGKVADGERRIEQVATDAATLSGQVKLLDERAEGLAGDVGTLQGRVAAVEDRIAATSDRSGRAATLALLAGQLGLAIDQAQPYDTPLESLRALAAEDPAVSEAMAQLEANASTGVPSLAQLRQSFEDSANDIVHAARAPEGEGMLDRAAGNLMRLVTVRPVGADTEGNDAAARVARAEAKLGDGDLAGAVAELEGLEGPAAKAAAPWLEQARARLAAQNALASLNKHTAGLLAKPQ